MKKLYCFILLTGSSIVLNGQTGTLFNGNQIETKIVNKNGLFVDWSNTSPTYKFPAGANTSPLWLANLWIYGKDSITNVVKGFGDRYFAGGQDTWPGPLLTDGSALTDSTTVSNFDKVWKVTKQDIDSFIVNFNNGNVTNLTYPVPTDMISWPVNASIGYEQPHSPYYDNNGDGFYNVYDGDYPMMKGDQMLRWIFNDNFDIHTEALAPALGFEIQADFYGCSSTNLSDPINRTTFLDYKIINRSDSSYKEIYIGLNVDADIGGALDDYIRSNVTANTMQFYNADNHDDPYAGAAAYLNAPPVQSITVLKVGNQSVQPLMGGMMYYNNSPGVTGDPVDYHDQYNYLQGYWKDGSHMVYGGNGYPAGPLVGSPNAQYMFPGDSDPTNIGTNGTVPSFYWTEENTGSIPATDPAGDRRGLISIGPLNLSAGESIQIVFALITTQDSTITIDSLLRKNIFEVNEITTGYINETFPCNVGASIGIDESLSADKISIFPNPAIESVTIKTEFEVDKVELLNLYGSLVTTIMNNKTFSVENLPGGIYFLRIYHFATEKPIVKKIIVIK